MTQPAQASNTPGAADPAPGSPEYVAKMAANYDAQVNGTGNAQQPYLPPAAKPARPADVPEKFWDAEKGTVNTAALLKSYTELERQRGAAPKGEAPKGDKPAGEAPAEGADGGPSQVDWNTAVGEYLKAGEFTKDTLVKFAKAGVPPEALREFAAQRKAAIEQNLQETTNYAKTRHGVEFQKAIDWGRTNLDPIEAQAINTLLNSPKGWQSGVDVLVARMRSALPGSNEPTQHLMGDGGAAASGGPFASVELMTAAINDPRYAIDPVYRDQVRKRVALTNF